jgi:MbtH protein
MKAQQNEELHYAVVINEEEQYSIWPLEKAIPLGWKSVGHQGNKADCLAYIKQHWTDMRPLSLRKQMESLKNTQTMDFEELPSATLSPTVKFLSEGKHPLRVYPYPSTSEHIKTYLEEGFIHLNFLDTKGETCLGFQPNSNTDKSQADFRQGKGKIYLEGNLILDYVNVKCQADIDLSSGEGYGQLVLDN